MSESIEELAETIHKMWLESGIRRRRFRRPYRRLRAIDREDNRAAARRIPRILSLVGLGIVKKNSAKQTVSRAEATKFLTAKARIERLAEAEHDGWMEHRLANGWRYRKDRDDKKNFHNCLIPYADLPRKEKDKDRRKVASFPRIIEEADYRLIWLRPFNA